MNQNLANVYALLKEKYGEEYIISYAQKPTYLEYIVGQDNDHKVVFVRREDRSGLKSNNVFSPTQLNIENTESTENLNLTGSPLKDDGVADILQISADLITDSVTIWKPEEEFQKGLAVKQARSILCNENFQKQQFAGGSVWILCDALDSEKTLLLQYEFCADYFSRGIVRFTGFVPVSSLNSSQLMLEKHGAGQKVETFIENVYNMQSDILVRCSWSTSSAKPALIDLKSCDVTLSHIFRLSNCGFLTLDFINQLRILICIRKDIIAYKEIENSTKEPVYQCGCGIEMDQMCESINNIMTEFGGSAQLENGDENECGIETVIHMAKKRRLNDLTDNIWDLLRRCSSYKDLKAAFHMIFQIAARCGIVNVPTNKNRLAEIITEVSNHRLAIPCLTGAEPLELLLEIGLEKLYKDYEYIFTESKICSPNSLKKTNEEANSENTNTQSNYRKSLRNAMKSEANTPRKTLLHNIAGAGGARKPLSENINCFRNSNFDEYTTGLKLSKLLQIHCTLEHLLMMQINFNLQNAFGEICETLLSRPLKPCDNLDDSFFDKMEISIAAHNNVRDYLEGKDPYSRRIILRSSNKFRQLKTTFFYSMENVCPPSVSEGFDNEELKIANKNIYYSWIYQKIQTAK